MLIVSVLYCLVWAGVLSYAFFTVTAQGARIEALATTIADQESKELAAETISNITKTTEAERNTLASYFVSESDAVAFLAKIEDLAARLGVVLETTELAVVAKTDKTPAELKTGFAFEGNPTTVMLFLKAIETVPYHSRIPTITLDTTGDKTWKGTVQLFVTITP